MIIHDILLAIPLGILLCFLIGPVFFVLLETAATKGFRAALVFDLGVVTADFFFIAVAYFSSYRLINNIKDEPALYIFGGLIMITYGLISFSKVRRTAAAVEEKVEMDLIRKNYGSLFFKGFLLNFINVGVLGFWILIFITFGPAFDLEMSRLAVFFASVIGTYLFVDIIKMLLAKKLKNKLTVGNILRIKKITSLLLVIFGGLIMLQGWFPSDQKFVKEAVKIIKPE
jgi:threonine/homoserine/homoserine lactone efflux protein